MNLWINPILVTLVRTIYSSAPMGLIAKLRHREGVSLKTFGGYFGVTASTVRRWERGEAQPRPTIAKKLVDRYGITFDQIYKT